MIALPGLTLETGKPAICREILLAWCNRLKDGLLPELIPWSPDAEIPYRSPDPSLWMFWTVQKYLAQTGDLDGIQGTIFNTLGSILRDIIDGKAPHIQVQKDGLLWVGDSHATYSWMDAVIDGVPVTPRHGLLVEQNALWHNALNFYRELCERLHADPPANISLLADQTGPALVKRFWCENTRALADSVDEKGVHDVIRPNMIFAVSLPYSPLTRDQKRSVIEVVVRDLVTPYGIRSLAPREPGYIGEYSGNPAKRDLSYHNGTVWPWLLGHFVEAYLSISNEPEAARERLRYELAPLFNRHLREGGVGLVSEIFNGNPPHKCKGCFAQAWSVAEVLRAWNLLNQRTT